MILVCFMYTRESAQKDKGRDQQGLPGGRGFPGGTGGKESVCRCRNHRDVGLISGSGRSPGGGNGNLLQYACLEDPTDRGVWWATVHIVTKSRTLLSDGACACHAPGESVLKLSPESNSVLSLRGRGQRWKVTLT